MLKLYNGKNKYLGTADFENQAQYVNWFSTQYKHKYKRIEWRGGSIYADYWTGGQRIIRMVVVQPKGE